jgi:hypothetical protein
MSESESLPIIGYFERGKINSKEEKNLLFTAKERVLIYLLISLAYDDSSEPKLGAAIFLILRLG